MNLASAALTALLALLALLFLPLGTAKILALLRTRAMAAESGMSTTAYRVIGALEVAGAAGLLLGLAIPLLGTLAGTGLLALLVGAVITHVRLGDGPQKYAAAVVMGVLVAALPGRPSDCYRLSPGSQVTVGAPSPHPFAQSPKRPRDPPCPS